MPEGATEYTGAAVSFVSAAPLITDPSLTESLARGLSPERRRKYLSHASPNDRALSLAASAALDRVLETVGLHERDGDVSYSELGAPVLPGYFLSVSHSGMLSGAMLSKVPCGLDIELKKAMSDERMCKLARRFFSRRDAKTVESAAPDNRAAVFYRLWTAREAFLKLLGKGFTEPRDSFFIDGERIVRGDTVFALRTYAEGGYCISVCSADSRDIPDRLPKPVIIKNNN